MMTKQTNGRICWPPIGRTDGETDQLVYLVEAEWAWQWPGWAWVASSLNNEYGNKRTPQACRAKYVWIMRKVNELAEIEKKLGVK